MIRNTNEWQLGVTLFYDLDYPRTSGPLVELFGHPLVPFSDSSHRTEILEEFGEVCKRNLGCPMILLLLDVLERKVV